MVTLQEVGVIELKGVGASLAGNLAKLGIQSVYDLLFHLPFRYEDRTTIYPISEASVGTTLQMEGQVKSHRVVNGRRRSLEVWLEDGSGEICLRFYYFNAAQIKVFDTNPVLRVFGDVRMGKSGFEMYHPEYRVVTAGAPLDTEKLTPVYSITDGVTQKKLRSLCQQALTLLKRNPIEDWLPPEVAAHYGFPEINTAINYLHYPPTDADVAELQLFQQPAQQRFVFEELSAHNLSLLRLRQQFRQHRAIPLVPQGSLRYVDSVIKELPFALTIAQQRVLNDIFNDLAGSSPMLRLVQGDVGSGKTVVAALAVLRALENGVQAAVMAPTEILAEQHLINFDRWLSPLGIEIGWLTGKVKGKKRQQLLSRVSSGEVQVVIGTHALFQDDVIFNSLALVVVDEQHRFGVHQRLALKEKGMHSGCIPHQLVMTATPIPRTLAMSAYADLDTSVIDELPPGRKPIETVVLSDARRDQVIERVRAGCLEGRQAYWVCTLIEESEVLQCQAAEVTHQQLTELLPELKVALIHGRMSSQDKADVMQSFKEGVTDLLIATTVIEVGVDVPNASLIIIENPERLGLAQLHQLRGRVGRGHQDSYCVLMYSSPLSNNGKARLQVMRESDNGFVIAEKDLEIRGPGEVLGTRQTGMMQFKMADLQRDGHWLPKVKSFCEKIPLESVMAKALVRRWLSGKEAYGEV